MSSRRQARGLFWGGVLILLGAWFFLDRLGLDMPQMDELWPVFPLLFGLSFLTFFFTGASSDPGIVWPGTSATLIGLFFFLFTFEIFEWSEMANWWPVFPLIAGISFFATWLAGKGKESGLLVTGALTSSVGVLGLFFTVGDMSLDRVRLLGSLLLIAFGLIIVLRSIGDRS